MKRGIGSAAYWERVALLREISAQKHAGRAEAELRRVYSGTVKDIDGEIRKIFNRYSKDLDLTREEAERLINAGISDETSLKLQELLAATEDPQQRNELMKRIHARAYGARISRLEAVKQNIYLYFAEKGIREIEATRPVYNTIVEESYYRTVHDIAKGCDVGINFSLIPKRAIDEIVAAPWHGAQFSRRVWNNVNDVAEKAQGIIERGLMGHKSYVKMAQELQAVEQTSYYNASRLVRTQANHFLNQAEGKVYDELGFEEYRYLATLDERTCEKCAPLDNRIFKMSEKVEGVNYPTIHPHCRCTTTVPTEYARRWARDPLTGKGHKIDNMSYDEWMNSLTEEQREAFEKNVKIFKNRSSDKILFEKYSQIYGKEFPKTLEKFQEMKYTDIDKWNAFKDNKQDRLNQMDFSDMGGLVGKLGNKEVRLWYKAHDEKIPDLIDQSLPLEQQARQACEMRNTNRTNARELMKDQKMREKLEKRRNKTFDELVEHKKRRYGLSGDDIYKDIIRSSATTNKKYDKIAGVE